MSGGWKSEIARRPFLAAILGVFGVAAVGGAVYELPALFPRRYPRTPYDDLLAKLPDRDNAARLGSAALKKNPAFDGEQTASGLRSKFAETPLADIVTSDLAAKRLTEVGGWVLPATLVSLCELAATPA